MDIEKLQRVLREFATERDWEQFHSPKNLAMALNVEAGELLEIFQWLTEKESSNPNDKVLEKAGEELADIILYSIRLADRLGLDMNSEVKRKIEANSKKYPVDKSKGNAKKYNEL
jgi:NTP pyrophosphatase (non-canonical NTP hydrolase)